jgi:hypothetical protein
MRSRYGKRDNPSTATTGPESLSKTAQLNHFTVTELSTGTDLEKLRLRAQNQLLWRKGVDAIIEEYKRKWTERENKRARYNPAQGGGRQAVARRGPGSRW